MASLSDTSKNSMRYRVTSGNESNSRLISGLNIYGGSVGTGATAANGVVNLADALQRFSQGVVDNIFYVQEKEVLR